MVGGLTTNILPTNEATLPAFTYNPSSNHENIIHEMSQYCWTTNILSPENYPLYGINDNYYTRNSSCLIFNFNAVLLKICLQCLHEYIVFPIVITVWYTVSINLFTFTCFVSQLIHCCIYRTNFASTIIIVRPFIYTQAYSVQYYLLWTYLKTGDYNYLSE